VVKLHRDAQPASGRVFGRLECVASGEHFLFATAEELLACLIRAESQQVPSKCAVQAARAADPCASKHEL